MFATVWAQAAPPVTSITATGFGRGSSTEIKILSWKDGVPDLLEVTPEGGEPLYRTVDADLILGSRWEELSTDSNGWVHGRVVVPGPGAKGQAYELSYRGAAGGIEYSLRSEDDPDGEIVGFAELPRVDSPDGRPPSSRGIFIYLVPIMVGALIFGCTAANASAMKSCLSSASSACGPNGVPIGVHYSGFCGVGTCEVTCRGLSDE